MRYGKAFSSCRRSTSPSGRRTRCSSLELNDLDAYWDEIARKDLEAKYPGVRTRPPTDFPWGREVNIVDPAGVCWHIRRERAAIVT